jgi:hypothetical protein
VLKSKFGRSDYHGVRGGGYARDGVNAGGRDGDVRYFDGNLERDTPRGGSADHEGDYGGRDSSGGGSAGREGDYHGGRCGDYDSRSGGGGDGCDRGDGDDSGAGYKALVTGEPSEGDIETGTSQLSLRY